MTPSWRIIPVAAVALVGIAGCGATSQNATPASSKVEQPRSADFGAPKVSNPVDIGKYMKTPCALVPKSLTQEIGVGSHGSVEAAGSNGGNRSSCRWGSGSVSLNVSFDNVGLKGQYQKQKLAQWNKYFIPTSIDGYPAVYASVSDDRKDGVWDILIGVNDKQNVDIDISNSNNPSQAKPALDKAAKAVVSTIKGAK